MPRLHVESGRHAGRSYELDGPAILGRSDKVPVPVPDTKASREHCRVFKQGDDWVVADLNSRNGIQVNGVKTTRKTLRDGDTITIGETVIAFRLTERPGSAAPGSPAETSDSLTVPQAAGRRAGGARPQTVAPIGDIDVDEIDVDDSPPARRPAARTPSARKPAASKGAASGPKSARGRKEAAFAAARADAAAARRQAASPTKGVAVRDDVLQFNRIDANKASLFQTDLSQLGGFGPLIVWGGALLGLSLIAWGIVKVMGVAAG